MLQIIRTAREPIQAKITLPGTESITYRALFLAALADGVSEISGMLVNDEIKTFINALHQVGIVIQLDEKSSSCIVAGSGGKLPKKQASIWCEKTKATVRFLMAACASSSGVYYFDGTPFLRKLALEKLFHLLSLQGAQFIPNDITHMPFTLVGADTVQGGDVKIDTSFHSQFISALLMMAPYMRSPLHLAISGLNEKHLIHATCEMMADFGVLVHRMQNNRFIIPTPQSYRARDYFIEPDFSIASYFFAAAALTQGNIIMPLTNRSLSQSNHLKFLSILKKMGCQLFETKAELTLKGPATLNGVEASMRDMSDNFLTLVVIALFANSPTHITHIGEIEKKENELLALLKLEFTKMNVPIEIDDHSIKIFPTIPQGALLNAHHNEYLTRAFLLLGLKVPGIRIQHAHITKNNSNFLKLWDQLTIETKQGHMAHR